MATQDSRNHMKAVASWLIAHKDQIGYLALRPMANLSRTEQRLAEIFYQGRTISMDCSESVTLICKYGGLADPTGFDYNGRGGSSNMYSHLSHFADPAKAGLGAIVVFGPSGSEHAAMVIEEGPDPLLFSHGSQAGPISISFSKEASFHKSPVTFLNIGPL